jgi:adenosylcobyric acid synthase
MLMPGQALPGDTDVAILPGSKSTRGDLAFLRAQGWDVDLEAHLRRGGYILGICGGYQMLGRSISDPEGIEGPPGETPGLGFLDVTTTMTGNKKLTEVTAQHAGSGQMFRGYEIHIGRTSGPDCARPFAQVEGREEGSVASSGKIAGSYLHGMFRDTGFRSAWLASLGVESANTSYDATVEDALDALADHLETHLDADGLLAAAS